MDLYNQLICNFSIYSTNAFFVCKRLSRFKPKIPLILFTMNQKELRL